MATLASAMSFANTGEQVKRKRGRPPKPNKLGEAFPTLTLQFQSPGSPTAELNSSMTVRMGEPDTFTPLMKVLPTTHLGRRKRRRRGSESPQSHGIPTPMSVSRRSHQLDAGAMDKMFSLGREEPGRVHLPAALRPPRRDGAERRGLVQFVEDDGFSLKIVVNDLGHAELRGGGGSGGSSGGGTSRGGSSARGTSRSSGASSDEGEAPGATGDPPHKAPAFGDDSTDTDKHIVPQTPKGDVYPALRSEETGWGSKLTPQFNTMMYSVMSLNSPQQGLGALQQFMHHQESLDSQARSTAEVSSIDTHSLLDSGVREAGFPTDERDARYALKQILKLS